MSNLERRITFEPAYDRRHPEPSKNYGIHGVTLRFLLVGSLGAVQFVLYTKWNLPHVQEELDNRLTPKFPHLHCHPLPADLGYHSPKPRYENHPRMDCDVLGSQCYYDGSGLNAEPVYERLLREGDAGVWAELEDYYKTIFTTEVDL